jgi:hypothetical protein
MVALSLAGCTAANPAFDLLDGEDDSAVSQEGPIDEAGESSDEAGSSDTAALAECGPYSESATVELFVGDSSICGEYVTTGVIEAITADEIHLRCDSRFDSDCLPDALAVLRVGYGLPPELELAKDRAIQLHWYTDANCTFAMVRVQYGDELRESFVALGTPGILQTQLVSYELDAEMEIACECGNDCCALPQGRYALVKPYAGGTISLGEGASVDAEIDGVVYRFRNLASNVTGDCRKAFHWQAVRL